MRKGVILKLHDEEDDFNFFDLLDILNVTGAAQGRTEGGNIKLLYFIKYKTLIKNYKCISLNALEIKSYSLQTEGNGG